MFDEDHNSSYGAVVLRCVSLPLSAFFSLQSVERSLPADK